MIAHKVIFGVIPPRRRSDAECAVESYISVLLHNGQAVGSYFLVVQDGVLCAYVQLAGLNALKLQYESAHTAKRIAAIVEVFGHPPKWTIIDDEAPKRDVTWMKAPFLYLFTHMDDWESPLCRGDNGKAIPIYRLSGTHEDREAIYFWQRTYQKYDAIWMGCGNLEMPTYRELASPSSALSQQGRQICAKIESTTGQPTYYFLMRYWGRRLGEESRKCPGCGKAWRTSHATESSNQFWHFPFRCDSCRLVSHKADSYDDERHSVIGEWKTKKRTNRAS